MFHVKHFLHFCMIHRRKAGKNWRILVMFHVKHFEKLCFTTIFLVLSRLKVLRKLFNVNFVFPRSYRSPEAMQKTVLWSANCEGQIWGTYLRAYRDTAKSRDTVPHTLWYRIFTLSFGERCKSYVDSQHRDVTQVKSKYSPEYLRKMFHVKHFDFRPFTNNMSSSK